MMWCQLSRKGKGLRRSVYSDAMFVNKISSVHLEAINLIFQSGLQMNKSLHFWLGIGSVIVFIGVQILFYLYIIGVHQSSLMYDSTYFQGCSVPKSVYLS